ncbi:MAG: DNA mismatch repair endonuclease MutL [Candidatus Coproplasma sp.]
MGKINLLSEEICNRIAAGEVIDRPYSAVKEMVENSLDAGATEIEIYIERGGKDLIRIVDNGCGIEKDDMRAAFFAHATSKISKLEDIDNIRTLGFRGEALATIAAISKVELVSVTEGNEANKVECDGEFIGKVQPAVLDKGTQITVRNIFFNTPVRAKFMKSDKKEEADITNFITRYILGNPRVAFKYYVDGKLALQSYGGGLEEAIAQVYGSDFLPHSFKIQAERNDIKIYGFIGNQNFFKPNKTYESIFLNGRYIINNVIATAITQAYAPYTMKRQYPFYTLFIDVPDDIVDVNVHPNKADVRFVDNQTIFGTVYKVISSVLDGTAKAAEFVVESTVVPEIKSTFGDQSSKNRVYAADYTQTEKVYDKNFDDVKCMPEFKENGEIKNKKSDPLSFVSVPPKPVEPKPELSVYDNYQAPEAVNAEKDVPLYRFYSGKTEKNEMHVCSGMRNPEMEEEMAKMSARLAAEQQKLEFESCKYKGNLFNTYLLYEIGDEVYMIDQHAAHERLIFDSLKQKLRERNVARQGMLIPYILDLNAAESAFIEKNIPLIRSMGFDIEQFGMYAYRVNEVPADLRDMDLKEFFGELLSDLDGLNSIKLEDVLKDKIAMAACKHAVKGGMELTEDERDKLFKMLKGDMGLKCPHGRPICVKLTKQQIEKMFKRIV